MYFFTDDGSYVKKIFRNLNHFVTYAPIYAPMFQQTFWNTKLNSYPIACDHVIILQRLQSSELAIHSLSFFHFLFVNKSHPLLFKLIFVCIIVKNFNSTEQELNGVYFIRLWLIWGSICWKKESYSKITSAIRHELFSRIFPFWGKNFPILITSW